MPAKNPAPHRLLVTFLLLTAAAVLAAGRVMTTALALRMEGFAAGAFVQGLAALAVLAVSLALVARIVVRAAEARQGAAEARQSAWEARQGAAEARERAAEARQRAAEARRPAWKARRPAWEARQRARGPAASPAGRGELEHSRR